MTGTRGGHWEPEGGRGTGPRGWGVTSAVFQQFSSPSCCLCLADLGRRFGFAALPGTNTCWALPKASGGAGGIGSAFLGCVLRQTPGPCFQLLLGKAELILGKGGCGRLVQQPGERRGGFVPSAEQGSPSPSQTSAGRRWLRITTRCRRSGTVFRGIQPFLTELLSSPQGNVVLWKPSDTALLSSYAVYKILLEAGLPPNVVQFVPSDGPEFGDTVTSSEHFCGLNFTGSVP